MPKSTCRSRDLVSSRQRIGEFFGHANSRSKSPFLDHISRSSVDHVALISKPSRSLLAGEPAKIAFSGRPEQPDVGCESRRISTDRPYQQAIDPKRSRCRLSFFFTPVAAMFPTCLSESSDDAPGQLLAELERRQDDVLSQLDDLENKLRDVLRGLNVEMEEIDLE